VPTPGHTPGHISVVVNLEDERTPDGVSPRASVAIDTMDRIRGLADSRPLVNLPTHDPESVDRLAEKRTLGESH
jgi:N-acyl homoserine lactone hydrolase